ncbi:chemotaxis protein CheW [Propionivibrio limicola]|uniref:chemotaxis protein CheW n=1 Tax=Propionivibrio limicola TaxID=167645 RepID=UPI0012910DE0|nr:chemotaxis protein CheW [Propionivibrio limicola]
MGQIVQNQAPHPVKAAATAALARSTAIVAGNEREHPSQYLTFSLAGEMFALGILNVKEIIEYGHLTEVPMMPAFVRGVINLRGSVVPVIDLSARFGSKSTEVTRRTCIIIVEVFDGEVRHDIGVLVDAVSEVLEIPGREIEPPPSFGARIRADFIAGMGKVDGKFVIILNIDKVLSVEEITLLTSGEAAVGTGAAGAAEIAMACSTA